MAITSPKTGTNLKNAKYTVFNVNKDSLDEALREDFPLCRFMHRLKEPAYTQQWNWSIAKVLGSCQLSPGKHGRNLMVHDCERSSKHATTEASLRLHRECDSNPVRLPNILIVACASSAPTCITNARDGEPYMLEDNGPILTPCYKFHSDITVSSVCNKPPERHEKQVHRLALVAELGNILKPDWTEDPALPEAHYAGCENYFPIFTQFESMLYGHAIRGVLCPSKHGLQLI